MTDSDADDDLIAAYRRGDAQALPRLVEKHLPAVWSLSAQLAGRRFLADDLAQESILRAIRGLMNFRGQSAFRTWLFRIVVNTSRDLLATQERHVMELDAAAIDAEDRSRSSPVQMVLSTELEERIAIAMENLPLDFRTALVLTTLHDFSPHEVSEMEGCSLNTIYWRIHEARKLLRIQLEPWLS